VDEGRAVPSRSGMITAPAVPGQRTSGEPMTNMLTSPPSAVPDSPAARRLSQPRWTDRRLLVGIGLVVASVLGVVRVVAVADETVPVWSVTSDLARGVTITSDDVQQTSVKLNSLAPYFVGDASPVGTLTTKGFAAGELVSRTGVQSVDEAPDLRWLTLPVESHHLPADLQRGERVDVYLVERTAGGEPLGEPRLVLAAATVAEVDDGDSRFGGSSLELGISLAVSAGDVATLVAAESRGTLTLARVPLDSA